MAAKTTQAHDESAMAAQLWKAADKLRGKMSPSRYKHPVLGLIFLKHISDLYAERRAEVETLTHLDTSDYFTEDESERFDILEDRDEYISQSIFWVPAESRWEKLQSSAKQPDIDIIVNTAIEALERENKTLKGVLPRLNGDSRIPAQQLGGLIDLISSIGFTKDGHADHDVLGRVYEYFLGQFSAIEGRGGEDYTPRSMVKLLVEVLEPKGRIFDPTCGSGGMFVQSAKFLAEHGKPLSDISVYGQESNPETWRLARMNLALRHIDANLGQSEADSLHNDQHEDLRADRIIANPPFNISDYDFDYISSSPMWTLGKPPAGNANYAFIQHFLYHLAPTGRAGFVLANGALTSGQKDEAAIRKALIEGGYVDCIVSLPDKMFANAGIPVSLWFLAKDERDGTMTTRARRGETLFVDARNLGQMISRRQRELTDADVSSIAKTIDSWRSKNPTEPYADVSGFCKSATLAEIEKQGFMLAPGRFVGALAEAEDLEPVKDKLNRLRAELLKELDTSAMLDERLRTLLGDLR